jgi:acetamidase/formamidase
MFIIITSIINDGKTDVVQVGDVLQVDILKVKVMTPWGWNSVRRGAGALKHFEVIIIMRNVLMPAPTIVLHI